MIRAATFYTIVILYFFNTILSSCSMNPQDDKPLSEFILGRWRGEVIAVNNRKGNKVEYQLEFINTDTLIYNSQSSFETTNGLLNTSNLVFRYEFSEDDRIIITNRLIEELKLRREGEYLIISSALLGSQDIYFRRAVSIKWPVVAILLGIFVGGLSIGLFRISLVSRKTIVNKDHLDNMIEMQSRKTSFLLNGLFSLIAFLIGVRISVPVWYSPSLLWIRLPWDGIISLEIGILIFSIGIMVILVNRNKQGISFKSISGFWNYLGIFLIGFSIYGILPGLLKIASFVIFGSYPTS